jgi:hypothetical protein
VAARSGPPPPPIPISETNTPKPKADPPKPKPPVAKRDTKKSFKGVVVKKKPKAPEKTQKGEGGSKPDPSALAKNSPGKEGDEKPPAKKQKLR